MDRQKQTAGIAAGVPYIAVPPLTARPGAPVVVAWHLQDAPRTETAFAAALPLEGLDAWRIYLGLPLSGARLPEGGVDELMRLASEDAVLNLQGPVAAQGAEEFPAAFDVLRKELALGDGPLALVGGSMGSAVAQLVLTETAPSAGLAVEAAVLISPVAQLAPVIVALSGRFGIDYTWSPESKAVAQRLDFVDRAGDYVKAGQPAVRLLVGADDDQDGFVEPTRLLHNALATRYDDPGRVDLVVIPGMAHALAEEPGTDPAPQTPYAADVDRYAVDWLNRHLTRARS